MNTRDLRGLLRGTAMVLHEMARVAQPELSGRYAAASAHVTDLMHKLPAAIPSVAAARSAATPVEPVAHSSTEFSSNLERHLSPEAPAARTASIERELEFRNPQEIVSPRASHSERINAAPVVEPVTITRKTAAAARVESSTQPVSALSGLGSDVTLSPDSGSAPIGATPATVPQQPLTNVSPAASPVSASQPLQNSPQPDAAPAAAPRKREFRERKVPSSQLARVWGFGSMAASMLAGAAGEAISGALGPSAPSGASAANGSGVKPLVAISQAQAERLAEGLCRMRGAALKIGQMLSIADEDMLPPAVAQALERVRSAADIMPKWQLEKVMAAELGPEWRAQFADFSEQPVAAASIGQVHRATLLDGRSVAVKVQYPGVADSINSDLNNLKALLTWANFLPKGLYLDSLIGVARDELTAECDYTREAEMQGRFRSLVGDDPDFEVPEVVGALCTRRVLTTTWLEGMTIDQVVERGLPQAVRDRIARKLLKLTLKELFVWRFMQTDPNWGNFFYNPATDRIGLLDFGACRSFPKAFVDEYLRLVWAAANNDRATIETVSVKLGFLTGYESRVMLDAHVDSGLVVGEPFVSKELFDFKAAGITARVSKYGAVFAEHRLTPPPSEVYSLHRKLAGAFLICIRMGAVMRCRDMLEEVWNGHQWGEEADEEGGGKGMSTAARAILSQPAVRG